jgi:hypothetical protein
MVGSAFTTKKMKLERKNWLRKTMLGTAIVAMLSGIGFGAYKLMDDEQGSERSSRQTSNHFNRQSNPNTALPRFAENGAKSVRKAVDGKRHLVAQQKSSKSSKAGKKSKIKKIAHHGKHKGHKWAKNQKHKGHKLAKHKKHGKHQLAHNKHKHKQKQLSAHHKRSQQARHLAAD